MGLVARTARGARPATSLSLDDPRTRHLRHTFDRDGSLWGAAGGAARGRSRAQPVAQISLRERGYLP